MDVVYLCRAGENEELRYSLRSLDNTKHDQVWIFGSAPHWVRNLRHYQLPARGNKHLTTNRNLREACNHPEVSDPFILMNDDFYFMQPTRTIPTQHRGTVRHVIDQYLGQGINSSYVDGMRRTLAMLETRGHQDPLSYELHTPMVVDKQTMLDTLNLGAYQRRTVYHALAGLKGRRAHDVKVGRIGAPIPDGRFLSTSDATFNYVRPTLEHAFPEPSRYEA